MDTVFEIAGFIVKNAEIIVTVCKFVGVV